MIRHELQRAIQESLASVFPEIPPPDFSVAASDDPRHGDYATNAAFAVAKLAGRSPMEIAEMLVASLRQNENLVASAEVAEPGFMNIKLAADVFVEEFRQILQKGDQYGNLEQGKGQRARVEYISANPTGPLHIGNARGGPLGETIARVLEKNGYTVLREYYHNDTGTQVEKMGETLWYWYKTLCGEKAEFPDDGYRGEYLSEIAARVLEKFGKNLDKDNIAKLTGFALEEIFSENMAVIEKMGIKFDLIMRESELLSSGKTQKVIEELKTRGAVKEQDGALWFAPGDEFLGDREAVLVRSTGQPTYFASDAAYHWEKFTSGYDRVVTVLGSNHHGHVPKLQAIARLCEFSLENFHVPLYQYVRIKRGDEVVKMSKRAGTYVTAKEVLDEVGPDALKFFLLMNSPSTHMDFDLELAKEQSQKNPVYYVQYAHARCASILRKAEETNLKFLNFETSYLGLLKEDEEVSLIKKLIQFPEVVEDTARDFQVQRLPHYASDLAKIFHNFYEKHRVITEPEDLTAARVSLIVATQETLKGILELIGITAPEVM